MMVEIVEYMNHYKNKIHFYGMEHLFNIYKIK